MKNLVLSLFLLFAFSGCIAQEKSSDEISDLTFCDYSCTQDCSGHEAGYKWARDKGIDDSGDCGGNSQSFIEGCKAYASGC